MKRKIQFLLYFLLLQVVLTAQQDLLFTQFMQKKVAVNPAYAGSKGYPVLSAIHRQQWVGLDGAPSTQAISIHAPVFAERVGIGFTCINEKIGYFKSLYLNGQYNYRMKIGTGALSLGIQGSYRRLMIDVAKAETISGTDPIINGADALDPIFNFGIGAYYEAQRFYAGASVPRFLEKNLGVSGKNDVNNFNGEVPHYYLMAGYLADLTKQLKIRPAMQVKYVEHAPVNIDMNCMVAFREKLWAGATYRFGLTKASNTIGTLDLLLQYQISDRVMAGLAYGYALSEIRQTNAGSYEIMLEYGFAKSGKGVRNPRFF